MPETCDLSERAWKGGISFCFKGEIWYDLVDGHFLFKQGDYFYDWTGCRTEYQMDKPETVDDLVKWSDYKKIDPVHYDRIVRDVIN